jgi:hypothetical protein
MPTFSFPSAPEPAPEPPAEASTIGGDTTADNTTRTGASAAATKKTRNTKKTTAAATTATAAATSVTEEKDESQPTFPDIVILKQTDKNYIVKHNHYPVSVNEKKMNEELPPSSTLSGSSNVNVNVIDNETTDLVSPNQIYKGQINKKRGRKPKAGFILNSNSGLYDTSQVPNIILHLKCHLSDLKTNESIYDYTPSISEVESYNLATNNLKSSDLCQTYNDEYETHDDDNIEHNTSKVDNVLTQVSANVAVSVNATSVANTMPTTATATSGPHANAKKAATTESTLHVLNDRYQKEISKKINRLKYSFHNGETIQMKLNHKCACFWDTCEFDGPIYYLPIMIVNGVFHVSGCFCSPECALAALLKDQLDTSTKFERIHLLHLLYGSANNKGFKPAPNPNYLLDKYYGNLTIDEYRSLLKSPQMIHIVNKPLTHILPELYEDNNDFLVNSKVIPTNNLKLKKRYKTMVVQGGAE